MNRISRLTLLKRNNIPTVSFGPIKKIYKNTSDIVWTPHGQSMNADEVLKRDTKSYYIADVRYPSNIPRHIKREVYTGWVCHILHYLDGSSDPSDYEKVFCKKTPISTKTVRNNSNKPSPIYYIDYVYAGNGKYLATDIQFDPNLNYIGLMDYITPNKLREYLKGIKKNV